MKITTVGLDLAKSVFQVHAVDGDGNVVVRRALRRAQVLTFFKQTPPCLVGMEACGTSHFWARELSKFGHEVRLMPPAYVKPYVERGKTDANDAEAICEAVTRPTMRFVPIKSVEQQAALALHRTRDLLVKQRTQLVNMIRSLLAEFGIETARGLHHALELAARIAGGATPDVPELTVRIITSLAGQIGDLQVRVTSLEKELLAWHRANELSQRLSTIPGIGIISATALAASVTDPSRFRSGRQFAASLGLTPRQNSSGGKERMGRISRMGDRYLRRLLVVGMTSLVRRARANPSAVDPRIVAMLARKPVRVATVAMANRAARVAWSIMTRGEIYRAPTGLAAWPRAEAAAACPTATGSARRI
ncbi:MAG TPA: IS110 family transposase [Aliidongia sp.]|nr:IS110 family transposase [Aliidongia sp.]